MVVLILAVLAGGFVLGWESVPVVPPSESGADAPPRRTRMTAATPDPATREPEEPFVVGGRLPGEPTSCVLPLPGVTAAPLPASVLEQRDQIRTGKSRGFGQVLSIDGTTVVVSHHFGTRIEDWRGFETSVDDDSTPIGMRFVRFTIESRTDAQATGRAKDTFEADELRKGNVVRFIR